MKKKIISILFTGIIATGSNLVVANANSNITDVKGHWAERQITEFIDKGYVRGYPDATFKPDDLVTRAEFVVIFNNVFGLKEGSNKVFNDTKGHWAKEAIDIAVTNGVCDGISATNFAPDDKLTREQASKMLSNYLKLSDHNIDKLQSFIDFKEVSSWAVEDVEGVIEKGYMKGYPDKTFKPLGIMTRAEAVSMLSRVSKGSEEISIEEKIVGKHWISLFDEYPIIVSIRENKIDINFTFHEGLQFDIIEKNIYENGITYKVKDSYGGGSSSNIFISINGNNEVNITCKDNHSYLNGNYTLANKDKIIQIAHEFQNMGDPDASYDDDYCIKYYDSYAYVFEQYGITLDDVKNYYENRNQKDQYLEKLNRIEYEVSQINYGETTLQMQEASSKVLKKWDDALNEIYDVLKTQLSSSEMESLRKEQREWIKIRDARAEQSASEFEGGTMYGLVYTETLGTETKQRCYELVNIYMK